MRGHPRVKTRRHPEEVITSGSPCGGRKDRAASGLEFRAGDAALSDDREDGSDGELGVIRNRDCDRSGFGLTLHHYMTTPSPDLVEAVFLQNLAGVSAGKDPEFTHAPLRSAL